jgi:hypothetical protein
MDEATVVSSECEIGSIVHWLAHEAIEMARRLGDAEVLYEVLFCAMGALVELERPEIRKDRAAVLAERGATPANAMRTTPDRVVELMREGEFWTVRGFGELCRIRDSRGIQMLARLTTSPRQEIHALDLSGAALVDGGDAGTALDAGARDAYRDHIHELRSELAQAEAWNDAGRGARIQRELDALCAQLAGAFGLGARPRRTGAAAERARQNVRRRIANAIQRITTACPEIGRHLGRTVRTGTACSYEPDR